MGDTEEDGAQCWGDAREEQRGGEHWGWPEEGDSNALGFGDMLGTRRAPLQLQRLG